MNRQDLKYMSDLLRYDHAVAETELQREEWCRVLLDLGIER